MISGDFLMGWNLLQILTSDCIIITMMVIISKMVVKMVMTMLLMTIFVMLMMVIIVLVEWCRRHRGAQGDCRTKKYFRTFKKCDDHSKKDDHDKK